MANLTPKPTAASKLRELLAGEDIITCPGVYDGLSARIALNTGFKILYMVSSLSLGILRDQI
jgi:2-methylisocitrate lyase-like PEP mutase family enzyme